MPHHDASQKPVGRLRAAWLVLMGQRVTPRQIEHEWIEYKQIFDDVLTRLSAQLARQAKAERERIKRQLAVQEEEPQQRELALAGGRKAELRSRAAQLKGLGNLRVANGGPTIQENDEP